MKPIHLLLAESLGAKLDPDTSDYVSEISLRLDNATVEGEAGELGNNVRKLCGASILDTSIQFVRYSVYLSSNNLLTDLQTDKFLQWKVKNGLFWILDGLLKLKLPTVEMLASNILLSAIRQNDINTVRKILVNGVEVNITAG